MRNAVFPAFREWLLAAVVAFAFMETAEQVLPGHHLTLPVIALTIGVATLGKLSYSLEKVAVRRFRSRRSPDGT